MDELEIWRAASLMMRRHGSGAQAESERRAAQLEAEGNRVGAATWLRIALAIEELQRKPTRGDRVH